MQVPWLQLSCYVFPGEGVEEVLSAAGSVLPLEVDPLQVHWAEQEASSPGKQQAGEGDHAASGTQVGDHPALRGSRNRGVWCTGGCGSAGCGQSVSCGSSGVGIVQRLGMVEVAPSFLQVHIGEA